MSGKQKISSSPPLPRIAAIICGSCQMASMPAAPAMLTPPSGEGKLLRIYALSQRPPKALPQTVDRRSCIVERAYTFCLHPIEPSRTAAPHRRTWSEARSHQALRRQSFQSSVHGTRRDPRFDVLKAQ
jgi:hypothetical protein